ncbi:MAG: hypothetical protein OXL95_04545 [Nitrospira sp.]|nr:hypothetical protein [Nitrospira sp.]
MSQQEVKRLQVIQRTIEIRGQQDSAARQLGGAPRHPCMGSAIR